MQGKKPPDPQELQFPTAIILPRSLTPTKASALVAVVSSWPTRHSLVVARCQHLLKQLHEDSLPLPTASRGQAPADSHLEPLQVGARLNYWRHQLIPERQRALPSTQTRRHLDAVSLEDRLIPVRPALKYTRCYLVCLCVCAPPHSSPINDAQACMSSSFRRDPY